MFTGIITHLGILENLDKNADKDTILTLKIPQNTISRKLDLGCSIACNGICLTLISQQSVSDNLLLSFQASKETCQKTTLKNWVINQVINLEFSMRLGDELGGHLVSGHVDDITKITAIKKIQDSWRFDFKTPQNLKKFISKKGSVTINGISLTVNEVEDDKFSVNIIQHTIENTNFQFLKIRDFVNLEIDLIARYLHQFTKHHE